LLRDFGCSAESNTTANGRLDRSPRQRCPLPAKLLPAAFARPSVRRIALAGPASVAAGVYARRYLDELGLWHAVESKIVSLENVRAALAVKSGNAEARHCVQDRLGNFEGGQNCL
jgi:Bacterial extracellular solute-binding protein